MLEITFDQLLEATRDLQPEERQALAQVLHFATPAEATAESFAETEVLNEAGAYSVFTPLTDTHPHVTAITDADLIAAAQCISCEWEEDLL